MSYPKATGQPARSSSPPYNTETSSRAHKVCTRCGVDLGEIRGQGAFFCSTECADIWLRQLSSPETLIDPLQKKEE